MRTLFSFLILSFILLGCTHKNKFNQPNLSIPDTLFTKHPQFAEIEIPVDQSRPILAEDLTVNIDFIPLESKQGAYLKRVDDIFTNDSLILINTRENVKYFNHTGEYLFTFENVGRGPSEYTTIFGFAVDFPAKKMTIADVGLVKLYDLEGNFLRALKLPGARFSLTPNIAFLNSEYLLLENDRTKPYYDEGYSPLWGINIDNNEATPLFQNYPDSVYRFRKKYTFHGNLLQTENAVLFRSVDSYNLYEIDNDSNVRLRYQLNFGDREMPSGALHDADNFLKYRERFARIYSVYETDKYLFIKYGINRVESYAIFDNQEKKVIAHQPEAEGFASKEYPDVTFWPSTVDNKGRLVCVHPAENFVKGKVLKGIARDDNIVLSIITLK